MCTDFPSHKLLLLPHSRSPSHLHLLHLGMGVEELLEFSWVDVLSAPNNHVLAAADNPAVAVLIQARDVPATTPQSEPYPREVEQRLGRPASLLWGPGVIIWRVTGEKPPEHME